MALFGKTDDFDHETLTLQLADGNERAFKTLYDRYAPAIFHVAERLLHSRNHSQDVVQEVFSSLWTHREELVKVKNLEAYIKTMARNQIYTELRKWSSEQRLKTEYTNVSEISINNGDFLLMDAQNEQLLEEIVKSLPPRQQEIFNLARKEGLSHDTIAETLNVSQGTVKNHMVRALQTIRLQLSAYLDSPPAVVSIAHLLFLSLV